MGWRRKIVQVAIEPDISDMVAFLARRFIAVGTPPLDAARLALALVAEDLWRANSLAAADAEIYDRVEELNDLIGAARKAVELLENRHKHILWVMCFTIASVCAMWIMMLR
jgi:hypothetical protein